MIKLKRGNAAEKIRFILGNPQLGGSVFYENCFRG